MAGAELCAARPVVLEACLRHDRGVRCARWKTGMSPAASGWRVRKSSQWRAGLRFSDPLPRSAGC